MYISNGETHVFEDKAMRKRGARPATSTNFAGSIKTPAAKRSKEASPDYDWVVSRWKIYFAFVSLNTCCAKRTHSQILLQTALISGLGG